MLLDNGLPPLTGADVFSSRAIDLVQDWEWDRVLVLDDNIIFGSTLAGITDTLRSAGARTWKTRAVCSDREQMAPYLLASAHASALIEADTATIEQFSKDVIRVLYRNGRPLFTDFPVGLAFECTKGDWLEFVQADGWRVADVTAPLLEDCERTALAKVPSAVHQRELFGGLPASLTEIVELGKLRAYVSETQFGVAARLVPICLIKPVALESIDALLGDLCSLGVRGDTANWLLSLGAETKYRLLQYLLSRYFLLRVQALEPGVVPTVGTVIDEETLRLNFGPALDHLSHVVEVLRGVANKAHEPATLTPLVLDRPRPYELLSMPDIQRLMWEQQELIARTDVPGRPAEGEVTKVGLAFAHAVTSIFGYIGERYEKPQRKKLASLHRISDYRRTVGREGNARVLSSGFTLEELADLMALTGEPDDEWSSAAITLALDIGNDLGIVVPIIRVDEVRGVVYRCFRLGETSVFASVPLGEGQWSEKTFDDFTACLYRGYPLQSAVHSAGDLPEVIGRAPGRRKLRRRDLEKALDRFIRGALPGRSERRYLGSVIDSTPNEFLTAQLRTLDGVDAGLFDLQWEVIDPNDFGALAPDAEIVWTVFTRIEEGNRLVASRVHVLPDDVSPETTELVAAQLLKTFGDE
ncbi:MAG: hypothetical protein LCH96_08070 [Actinobacteria bacterium]|nr:hypothetical protein [Actinomycetota bacterium]